MCLSLIPNHLVLVFLKDGCSLPPSSTEWNNHRSIDASTWEFEYLDPQARFRDLMNIEKERNRPHQKRSQTMHNPFCVTLLKKQSKNFKL